MPAPLTIAVPTFQSAATLPACLSALFEGLEAGLIREVLILDAGSTDATAAIADDAGAEFLSCPAAGARAKALEAARGSWLMMLPAHVRLMEGWSLAVEAALLRGGPGFFPLQRGGPGGFSLGLGNLVSSLGGRPIGARPHLVPLGRAESRAHRLDGRARLIG